jgi:hypothetical protein
MALGVSLPFPAAAPGRPKPPLIRLLEEKRGTRFFLDQVVIVSTTPSSAGS